MRSGGRARSSYFWFWVRVLVGGLLSLGLGWVAIQGVEWRTVSQALKGLSPLLFLLSLGLYITAGWVRALRWRLLFVGQAPTMVRLFLVENMGLGSNNLVPIRVLSEPVQFTVLTLKDRVKGATAALTLGMQRLLDLWATLLLFGVLAFFVPQTALLRWYPLSVGSLALVGLGLLALLARGHRIPWLHSLSWVRALVRDVGAWGEKKGRVAASFGLTLLFWATLGLSAWVLGVGLGLSVLAIHFLLVVLVATFFAGNVPAAPGALGTYEFAMVFLLGLFEVERSLALSFALVYRVITYGVPTSIAVLFLPREGINLMQRLRSVWWLKEPVAKASE